VALVSVRLEAAEDLEGARLDSVNLTERLTWREGTSKRDVRVAPEEVPVLNPLGDPVGDRLVAIRREALNEGAVGRSQFFEDVKRLHSRPLSRTPRGSLP